MYHHLSCARYQRNCVAKRLQAPCPKLLRAPGLAVGHRIDGWFEMRGTTPTPRANLPHKKRRGDCADKMRGCKLPQSAPLRKPLAPERTHSSHVRSCRLSTSEFEFNQSLSASGRPSSSHEFVQTMRGTKYRNRQMADCWQRLS